jgi:hypothetical protein
MDIEKQLIIYFYTSILSNPTHLTIGSNQFWFKVKFKFQNVVMQILKVFVCV